MSVNNKIITPENMSIIDARDNLPSWLITSAILDKHGGMNHKLVEIDNLIDATYRILGKEEYTRIYKKTVKEFTGEDV